MQQAEAGISSSSEDMIVLGCGWKKAEPDRQQTLPKDRATARPQSSRRECRPERQRLSREHRQGRRMVHGVVFDRFNDPSAGSPTETLLRLLLPLGGRV